MHSHHGAALALGARVFRFITIFLAACTASAPVVAHDPDPIPGLDDGKLDSPNTGWASIGLGVEYERVNTGNAILIAYGGYTAHMGYSAAWATELVDAKLGGQAFGQIYAVKGPQDPGYAAREIGNSKLRRHLVTIDDGTSPIYVIAHSSGAYVAHELLGQLYNAGSTSVLARVHYYCLDGGGSGLSDAIVASLASITFVSALDPSLSDGYSENHDAAESLASEFAPKATSYVETVSNTGCADGYGWCLHDVLVTHRPHDPYHFDLADDYTDFVDRPVSDEYF